MLRYYFNTNTEIVITDDANIKVVQNRNDTTQELFKTKEEAIAWATAFANELNKTIVASDEVIIEPTEIELLREELAKLKKRTDSTENAIIDLMDFL